MLLAAVAAPIVLGVLLVGGPLALLIAAIARRFPAQTDPERANTTICTFARSFPRRSVDTLVLRVVWEHVSAILPVRADDDLCADVGLEDPDMDLDLDRIAHECGRSMDGCERNAWYGRVATVRDLVHFLDAQPRLAA